MKVLRCQCNDQGYGWHPLSCAVHGDFVVLPAKQVKQMRKDLARLKRAKVRQK